MGVRALVVGCGELGSRHLQALSTVSDISEIEVVDPSAERLEVGRRRIGEVPERRQEVSYRWLPSLAEASPAGALCVVATRADVRPAIIREVAERLGYRSFLIEKIVAQTPGQYKSLMSLSKATNASIWVNCKTRAHASHKRVKEKLDPDSPIVFSVTGGNHGLANNGIHAADLFAFYDGATAIHPEGANIEAHLHASKRGGGIFDLAGTLLGSSEKGSQFMLSFSGSSDAPFHCAVTSPRYRAIVDDMARTFLESTPEDGWRWSPVPLDENMLVSQFTRRFAADILQRGTCELPTLAECWPAHEYILSQLQPHFRKLLQDDISSCPVT